MPCPSIDEDRACALAFSTLLSSQGADAHRRGPCGLFWGNPANLPGDPRPVKLTSTRLGLPRDVLPSLPRLHPARDRARVSGTAVNRSGGGVSPCQRPGPSGHHETLGGIRDLVNSRRRPDRAPARRSPGPRRRPSPSRAGRSVSRSGRDRNPAVEKFPVKDSGGPARRTDRASTPPDEVIRITPSGSARPPPAARNVTRPRPGPLLRDDLGAADRALAAAQDQEPAVQQIGGRRDRAGVSDLLVVEVGAALVDGPPGR